LPNKVATVRFSGALADEQVVLHGETREAIESQLRARDRAITIVSIDDYRFDEAWGRRANAKKQDVQRAYAARQRYEFGSNALWQELKDFLFAHFDETCAYCEVSLRAGCFGAVEHYRPKSSVREAPGHPGYYWLAYEVTNYLPTCDRCNNAKSDRFPLVNGCQRALMEGQEADERPLLISPYEAERIEDHIEFVCEPRESGRAGPVAMGITERGAASIDILELNRPELLNERWDAQNRAVTDYLVQRVLLRPVPVLQQLVGGQRPFAAAARAAVQAVDKGFPTWGG
jgi:hypothetical protein